MALLKGIEMVWGCSSAGEHFVDIEGVTGSIPVTPTIFLLKLVNEFGHNMAAIPSASYRFKDVFWLSHYNNQKMHLVAYLPMNFSP